MIRRFTYQCQGCDVFYERIGVCGEVAEILQCGNLNCCNIALLYNVKLVYEKSKPDYDFLLKQYSLEHNFGIGSFATIQGTLF